MQVYILPEFSAEDNVHSIAFYDAETGNLLHSVEIGVDHFSYVRETAISPKDKLLAIATYYPSVELWDISNIYHAKKVASIKTQKEVESLVFLNEEALFFMDETGLIDVWRSPFTSQDRSNFPVHLGKFQTYCPRIGTTLDQKYLLWNDRLRMKMWKIKEDNNLEEIELIMGEIDQSSIQTLWDSFLNFSSSVIMSPDNRFFIIPEIAKNVYYRTKTVFRALKKTPEDHLDSLFFSPDKDILLAAQWQGFINVYNLREGTLKIIRRGSSQQDDNEIRFSKDGKKVGIFNDNLWSVLDVESLKTKHILPGFPNAPMFIIDTMSDQS